MPFKLLRLLGTTLASAASVLAAESFAQSTLPQLSRGGTLTVALTADPGNLDPISAASLTSNTVYNVMCEKLYEVNADGVVFPQLAAELPVFAADGLSADIALRKNVKFADGTAFDADAVVFGLDRNKHTQGSARASELVGLRSFAKVDDHTVRVEFAAPTASGVLTAALTTKGGSIVSPTAVAQLGSEGFNEQPACVGPFKLESRVALSSVTVVPDPNYYGASNVHLDKIVFQVIPDANVRTVNLRSGDIDVIEGVAVTDISTLEQTPTLKLLSGPGIGFYFITFNINNVGGKPVPLDTPVAADPRVRKAFELSIDRDVLNRVVFQGRYQPACGFMAPNSEFASETSLDCPDADPQAARSLLAEAGHTLPLRVRILVDQRTEVRRMAEVIQSMVAEAGFDVTIDTGEAISVLKREAEGDFEIDLSSWSGRVDPDGNIARFVESTSGRSIGKYSSPEMDALLAEARSAPDKTTRIARYNAISELLRRDTPLIFLVRPDNLIAHKSTVVGLELRANGTVAPAFAGFADQ